MGDIWKKILRATTYYKSGGLRDILLHLMINISVKYLLVPIYCAQATYLRVGKVCDQNYTII